MNEVRLSKLEYSMILISSITVTGHLIIVALVFAKAGRDGWISLFLSLFPGLYLVIVLSILGARFPKTSLLKIYSITLGKPLGKLINLLYFIFFTMITVITLKLLMDFMSRSFMPATPQIVFGIVFILVSAYALFLGLETFARANQILLPILIFVGILASALSAPSKDYQQLLPLLENGIKPVLKGTIPLIALFCELVVIGILQANTSGKANLWKVNSLSLLIIGLMFIGPLTGPIATFGQITIAKFIYPTFNQITYIEIDIVNNLQPLAIILWVYGSFAKISLFFYASTRSLIEIIGFKDYTKLIIPIGVGILLLAIILFPNLTRLINFILSVYIYLGFILGLIIPTLILLISFFRKDAATNS